MRLVRKRLVRLHLDNDQPSVEGILVGTWAGHYTLRNVTVVQDEETSYALEGPFTYVPKSRVVLVQGL